jgi:hypothetical protein
VSRIQQVLATLSGWSPNRRRVVGGLLGVTGVIAVIALGQIWTATQYDLRDSAVWVMAEGRIGRVNTQIAEMDYHRTDPEIRRLEQDGRSVYVLKSNAIDRLDVADPAEQPETTRVDSDAEVHVGGGTVAVREGRSIRIVGQNRSFPIVGPEIDLGRGDDQAVAVGADGTVAAFSPGSGSGPGRLRLLPPDASEAEVVEVDLPSAAGGDVQLTMVGGEPVVLFGDLLLAPRSGLRVEDIDGELQEPGPSAREVLVATDRELVAVGLDGGRRRVLLRASSSGEPVRPAVGRGCAWAAWTGAELSMAARCGDEVIRDRQPAGGGPWAFRTGGPVPVLNDVGAAPQQPDGTPQVSAHQMLDGRWVRVPWPADQDNSGSRTTVVVQPPDRAANVPPIARDDADLGARPGRTTYLPVLLNDYDRNQDPLVVDPASLEVTGTPAPSVKVAVAPDRRSVVVEIPADVPAGGAITFSYRAHDGLTASASAAAVTVTLRDPNSNQKPVLPDGQSSSLGFRTTVGVLTRQHVLDAFYDPDGDPIHLARAEAPAPHLVDWDPGGEVRFTGGEPGAVTVSLVVDDDHPVGDGAPASLVVQVDPADEDNQPPVLRNDATTAVLNEPIVIRPLDNDMDPDGDPITLVPGELTVLGAAANNPPVPVVVGDHVEWTASRAGRSVIRYLARDGEAREPVEGQILVEVIEPGGPIPPIARPDVLVVPADRAATVDLIANDVDVAGGVLAVEDFRAVPLPEQPGVPSPPAPLVGLTGDLRTVRVDTFRAAPGVHSYTYRVTNGVASASSTLVVLVEPAVPDRQPVVASPAPSVQLRAGEVASVPLARVAEDPDGDPLVWEIRGTSLPDGAEVGLSGETLRFRVPPTSPGDFVVPLTFTDPSGSAGGSSVTFLVRAADGPDQAPEPPDLEVRVAAGAEVLIRVPLESIDPDGDAVRLLGPVVTPGAIPPRGAVTLDESQVALRYRAPDLPNGGVDRFDYEVRAWRGGERAKAAVRVVIVRRPDNRPPTAFPDRITVARGSDVAVDPLANDSDPDGDVLVLALDAVEPLAGPCLASVPTESKIAPLVEVTTPEVGTCSVAYGVHDVDPSVPAEDRGPETAIGLPVLGELILNVLPEFDGLRPVARDDVARRKGDAAVAIVPILDNDVDPDGSVADLQVEVPAGTRLRSDRRLEVPLLENAQVLRYRIIDGQELDATAYVFVPGRENRLPEPAALAPIDAPADQETLIDLSKSFIDPDGETVTFLGVTPPATPALDGGLDKDLRSGQLRFRPVNREFAGEVTLQVRVKDAQTADEVVLPLVVNVVPGENRPPNWTSFPCAGAQVEIDGDPLVLSLPASATDPDPTDRDQLEFTVDPGERGGVTAVIEDQSRLVLRAGSTASEGKQVFRLVASDRATRGGDAKSSESRDCDVQVVESRQGQLIVLSPDLTTTQDRPVSVDVADLVGNERTGLRITEKPPQQVEGGRIETQGTRITFSPDPGFAGRVTASFVVTDDLDGDTMVTRAASGTLTILVQGRPLAPDQVTATPGDGKVTLQWRTVQANESPLEGFEIRAVKGAGFRGHTCPASGGLSGCTLGRDQGIRNGVTYQFTVTPVNGVGPARSPSPPSGDVTPDAPPPRPLGLTAEAGDRQVTFRWSAPPPYEGTEVVQYVVDVNGRQERTGGTGTSWPVGGDNGTPICARVAAENRAGEGEFTPTPNQEPVCGVPFGAPVIEKFDVSPVGGGKVRVSWEASGNGRNITSWKVSGCGEQTDPVDEPRPERTVENVECGRGTRVLTLSVTNAGERETTRPFEVNAFDRPDLSGEPQIVAANGGVRVTQLPTVDPDSARYTIAWSYRTEGGSYQPLGSDPIPAAPWKKVAITLMACIEGTDNCRDSVPSNEVYPYGSPEKPTLKEDVTWNGSTAIVQLSLSPPSGVPPEWRRSYRYRVTYPDPDGRQWSGDLEDTGQIALTDADTQGGILKIEILDRDDETATAESTFEIAGPG